MKVFTSLVLSAASVMMLSAAEVIPLGKASVSLDAGRSRITAGKLVANVDLSWKTKTWFSMKAAKSVMTKPGKDQWQFKATVPVAVGAGKTNVALTVKKVNANTLQYTWSWDANHKEAIGHFMFFSFPIRDYIGKEISFNDKKVKINNIQKFGVYRSRGEEQSVTIKSPDGKTITLESEQNCSTVLSTFKNGSIEIRFTPVGPKKLTVTLTVK